MPHGAGDPRGHGGCAGWARPLDRQVLSCGWRLYNVNNLALVRHKESFPAPAQTDAVDTLDLLELFAVDGWRPLGRHVLQEVRACPPAQRELMDLTRRRHALVRDRTLCLARLRVDLSGVCPGLLALARAVDNPGSCACSRAGSDARPRRGYRRRGRHSRAGAPGPSP